MLIDVSIHSLPHIAATGQVHRRAALADLAHWFAYQTTRRLWPNFVAATPICPG